MMAVSWGNTHSTAMTRTVVAMIALSLAHPVLCQNSSSVESGPTMPLSKPVAGSASGSAESGSGSGSGFGSGSGSGSDSGSGSGSGIGPIPWSSVVVQSPSIGPSTASLSQSPTLSPTPSSLGPSMDSSSDEAEIALGVGAGAFVAVALIMLAVLLLCIGWKHYKPWGSAKCHPAADRDLSGSEDNLLGYPMRDRGLSGGREETVVHETLFQHIPVERMPSISLEVFPQHVAALHKDGSRGAKDEYHFIKSIDQPVSDENASLPYNRHKNRYNNILANDETRVMLSSVSKEKGSDYINANYIAGYSAREEYIATQGPLPETVEDFWRMVWEKNVHVIIMVTNLVERATIKCGRYWPNADEGTVQYGPVFIKMGRERQMPAFTVRYLTLTGVKKRSSQVSVVRQIQQFHFTSWPDFGVPYDCTSMLKYVRRVRRQVSKEHGPILTHCSAGVGRTGTYIAIDVMMQKIAHSQPVNIFEFVCQMRAQRNNMVQNKDQYLFIHDTVRHALLYGDTEVGVADLRGHLASLSQSMPGEEEEETQLDHEFKLVMAVAPPAVESCSVALSEDNASKNRSTVDIPLNYNRVVMDGGGVDDYINASWVMGYGGEYEFLVTQHPLMETREQFWRMVLEKDVTSVVTMGPLGVGEEEEEEEEEEAYLPSEGVAGYGGITVELVSLTTEEGGLVVRELLVECIQMGESANVLHYHMSLWPKDGAPPSPETMQCVVSASRRQWKEFGYGVIALHCTPGLGSSDACGVYCAVSILLEEAEMEGSVDVVGTAQQLCEQRPEILGRKDYYKFIYEVLVEALALP